MGKMISKILKKDEEKKERDKIEYKDQNQNKKEIFKTSKKQLNLTKKTKTKKGLRQYLEVIER